MGKQKAGKNARLGRKRHRKSVLEKLQDKAEILWKEYCKKRDKRCRICNGENILQVHHIFSRKSKGLFLDIDNGITLCRDCHCDVTFNDSAKDKVRRLIDPIIYDRLYEQSCDKSPFLEWKNIDWLEQQIEILAKLKDEPKP